MPDASDVTAIHRPAHDVGPRVSLRVIAGPHAGREWTFDRPTQIVLGREAPANIRLEGASEFSKQHCRLVVDPPSVRLVDLGSRNGTCVNGMTVAEAVLADGDEFGTGDTRIRVEIHRTAQASEPAGARVAIGSGTHSGTDALQETVDLEQSSFLSDALAPWADPPTTLGAYDLCEMVGEGGMARVFRAQHRKTQQQVAIKVIRVSGSPSDKMLQLFTREASLLLRLTHPRIVRSIEFGVQGKQPFLVMEWIPTIDLLVQVDAMTPEQRIRIGCWIVSRVLQALGYAHSQGIVHRDIKPANILGYRQAHRLQVKLGDFGLAKCFGDAGLSAMTDEHSIRGTLAYMAPEQMRDSRSVGPAADIFAAGACLHRLVTGTAPKVTSRGVRCNTAAMETAGLPAKLVKVIEKAMSRDTGQRFETAAAFEKALQRFHGK